MKIRHRLAKVFKTCTTNYNANNHPLILWRNKLDASFYWHTLYTKISMQTKLKTIITITTVITWPLAICDIQKQLKKCCKCTQNYCRNIKICTASQFEQITAKCTIKTNTKTSQHIRCLKTSNRMKHVATITGCWNKNKKQSPQLVAETVYSGKRITKHTKMVLHLLWIRSEKNT